jgi:hypothetical protein
LGILDKVAEWGDAAKKKVAHEYSQLAISFLEPGEQIQVAFKATPGGQWKQHVTERVVDVTFGMGATSYSELPAAIAVTDRAIFVIRLSHKPRSGPERYPRHVYLQLTRSKNPLRVGDKWFRLGDDIFWVDPNDWAYWEPWPPGPGAKVGPVEMAIAHANAALDIMIANQDVDAPPPTGNTSGSDSSPPAQEGATLPPPGWYPDPTGTPGMRYWDGRQWNLTAQPPAQ